jgi:hypothetical protein
VRTLNRVNQVGALLSDEDAFSSLIALFRRLPEEAEFSTWGFDSLVAQYLKGERIVGCDVHQDLAIRRGIRHMNLKVNYLAGNDGETHVPHVARRRSGHKHLTFPDTIPGMRVWRGGRR